jgi:hypothetical protein
MKNHFISLFDSGQVRKTIILFLIAAVLISVSLITGISDNLPMIAMLFAGIIFLFFALLHPWNKAAWFAILAAVCLVILILDFLWPLISEGFAMTVGFVCFAGIITGIIGIFTRTKSWKRLPYSGSLISLVALIILITTLVHPLKELIAPGTEWILIGLQLLITILLFGIGLINKGDSRLTRSILIFTGIVLILLSVWGFYASTWQFETRAKVFVIMMIRIYAIIEIIIASLSLYALYYQPRK